MLHVIEGQIIWLIMVLPDAQIGRFIVGNVIAIAAFKYQIDKAVHHARQGAPLQIYWQRLLKHSSPVLRERFTERVALNRVKREVKLGLPQCVMQRQATHAETITLKHIL